MQGISPVETCQHGSKLGLNRQALGIFPQEWVYKNVAIDHQNILMWALGKSNIYCNKVNTYVYIYKYMLVGGLEHFLFFHLLGIVSPTD